MMNTQVGYIMSEKRSLTGPMQVIVNRALPGCTGCRVCEKVCAIGHANELNPEMSRIKVFQFYPGPIDIPIVCQYCADKPCVQACPTKALTYDEQKFMINVNEGLCTSCQACNNACIDNGRGGCITFHPSKGTAQICDLCAGDSQCVIFCPNNVLALLPATPLSKRLAKPAQYFAKRIVEQFHPTKPSPF